MTQSTRAPALPGTPAATRHRASRQGRLAGWAAVAVLLVAVVAREDLNAWVSSHPRMSAWSTVFVSVSLQSLPFLVLGVGLSAAIAAALPLGKLLAVLPRWQAVAVPVAGLAGVVLPGCECASVPVAGGLIAKGAPVAPALAFLLAAPAINPIVLVSTSVAFPGRPEMVLARFTASLVAAVAMGWFWLRRGRTEWLRMPRRPHGEGTPPREVFFETMRHDLLHAGGFLVLGGMLAATVNVLLPTSAVLALQDRPWLAVLVLAALAVLVAICSEADAFVAASFTQFSPTAQLAFMTVGPMVDVKLVSMQVGTFGRRFAVRFAPATFVTAVAASVVVGVVLL